MFKKIIISASLVILIIGGLNWGLIGLFNINYITALLGEGTFPVRVIYILVGIAAVYSAIQSPFLAYLSRPWGGHTTPSA